MITSRHHELGSPQSYTTAVEDAPASAKSRDASEIPSRDFKMWTFPRTYTIAANAVKSDCRPETGIIWDECHFRELWLAVLEWRLVLDSLHLNMRYPRKWFQLLAWGVIRWLRPALIWLWQVGKQPRRPITKIEYYRDIKTSTIWSLYVTKLCMKLQFSFPALRVLQSYYNWTSLNCSSSSTTWMGSFTSLEPSLLSELFVLVLVSFHWYLGVAVARSIHGLRHQVPSAKIRLKTSCCRTY